MERIREHKEVLEKLCGMIAKEQECAKIIIPNNTEYVTDLEKAKKTVDDKFIVLIMGIFSSGKSSMINALIGEPLLPTGYLPETAVLGEMHYSTVKKITMYPKPGMWEGGDQPFDLENPTTEELAKYASIDNEAGINSMKDGSGRVIEAKFEKMVIHWPLDILKDNVVLVDSPGIDDPWNNDYITKAYIPKVDAIIYLMNSQSAYHKKDADQLDEINSMGNSNIVVGYTFFDQIMNNDPKSVSKIKTVLNAHAARHSDLGPDAVHYLSSLDGLRAKMTDDHALSVSSGYDGLEKYLARYLVEGKGTAQVLGMTNKIRQYADRLKKEAQTINGAVTMDDLDERIAMAQEKIRAIKRDSELTYRSLTLDLKKERADIDDAIDAFIPTLADITDLEGFEPETSLPTNRWANLVPFRREQALREIQKECSAEFQRRMNINYSRWVNTTLSPMVLKKEETCAKNIKDDLVNIAKQLNEIDGILVEGGAVKARNQNLISGALGVAFSLVTGDWYTGAMAALYGRDVALKSLAATAGVGAATGVLIAAGVAVSLPVAVGAAIVADLLIILGQNTDKQVAKTLKTVVAKSRAHYKDEANSENMQKNADSMKANVKAHMDAASDRIKKALNEDVQSKEKLIQITIKEANQKKEEREKAIAARNKAVEELDQLVKAADTLAKGYNGLNV